MGHISEEELQQRVANVQSLITEGGVYAHYRNPQHRYQVTQIAIDEETEQPVVIYRALYDSQLTWVRQVDNWLETVTTDEGKTVPRFIRVKE